MLNIDEQLLDVDDAIEELLIALFELETVKNFKKSKEQFLLDESLQKDIQKFQELQNQYEEIKEFEAFRPEVKEVKRRLFQQKRLLDINEKVILLRQNEVAVQEILASLSQAIAASISKDIFVDTGLPLASHKPVHKKGNNIRERKIDV